MSNKKTVTLALIGGGHTHALFLNKVKSGNFPACRLILISGNRYTPYSGMLPGVISGQYSVEQSHIDLKTLAAEAGCEFIEEHASALDPDNRLITTSSGLTVNYDWLSINTGSTQSRVLEAENAITIKPIAPFLDWLSSDHRLADQPCRLVIAGSGAAGVEIALALRERFRSNNRLEVSLLAAGSKILASHPKRVRSMMEQELRSKDIQIHTDFKLSDAINGVLYSKDQQTLAYDQLILATPATPASWPADSTLATSPTGFIAVNQYLQSTSHDNIFACGDVAHFQSTGSQSNGLAKCGVYAVRQAPTLFENLKACLEGSPMREFEPQSNFLSLLSCADGKAVASRGWLKARGRLVWFWKDWLDRQFMARFPLPEKGAMSRSNS